MKTLYDIHFVIPITEKPAYKDRIEHVKNYCLLNPQNRKVLLTLLADKNDKLTTIMDGWSPQIDVEIHKSDCDVDVYKVNSFFHQMKSPRAKWTAKIDDDTSNDIEHLCRNLEKWYDFTREYYLCGDILEDLEPEEIESLKAIGYFSHFYSGYSKLPLREYEGCFVSYQAMNRIIHTKIAQDFLKHRLTLKHGFTDLALAVAAQLCKIYPIPCPFMKSHPVDLWNFSRFGGQVSHIHFVFKHNKQLYIHWKRMINKKLIPENCPDTHNPTGQTFHFNLLGEQVDRLKFLENGTVRNQHNHIHVECFWMITKELKLLLLNQDGHVVFVCEFYNNSWAGPGIVLKNCSKQLPTPKI